MSRKPPKKSDMGKSWMKPRRDSRQMISPEYHLVSCSKVAVEPVVSCLELIRYDSEGLPTNMKRDKETGLHYAQFQLTGKHFVDAKGEEQEVSGSDFKCNVYLNSVKRTADLFEINTEINEEYEALRGKTTDELLTEKAVINKKLHYHTVNFDVKKDSNGKESWDISITENRSKIQKAKATCGYFSSITYNPNSKVFILDSPCQMTSYPQKTL